MPNAGDVSTDQPREYASKFHLLANKKKKNPVPKKNPKDPKIRDNVRKLQYIHMTG